MAGRSRSSQERANYRGYVMREEKIKNGEGDKFVYIKCPD